MNSGPSLFLYLYFCLWPNASRSHPGGAMPPPPPPNGSQWAACPLRLAQLGEHARQVERCAATEQQLLDALPGELHRPLPGDEGGRFRPVRGSGWSQASTPLIQVIFRSSLASERLVPLPTAHLFSTVFHPSGLLSRRALV